MLSAASERLKLANATCRTRVVAKAVSGGRSEEKGTLRAQESRLQAVAGVEAVPAEASTENFDLKTYMPERAAAVETALS